MKHDLWPTPLWHIEGAPQQLIDELYQGAYKFKERCPSENRSSEGGYQTPAFIWKEFHPQGIEYINKVVGDMFKFKVESWWYNINNQGHWNTPHTHSNCDYALVLYLTDSDGLLRLMNPFLERSHTSGDYVSINAKNPIIIRYIIFINPIIHKI